MTRFRSLVALAAVCALALLPLTGCNRLSEDALSTPRAQAEPPVAQNQTAKKNLSAPREDWYVLYLGDVKAGYSSTSVKSVRSADTPFPGLDGPLLQIDSVTRLSVLRFNQKSEQETHIVSIETPEGALIGFAVNGTVSGKVSGHVTGDKLILSGSKEIPALPWSAGNRGPLGDGESLEQQPMQPGQTRTIKMIVPDINQLADVELKARDFEKTDVLKGTQTLLRIEETVRILVPGIPPMEQTIWTDKQGQTVKTQMGQMKSYRTTRALALAPASGAKLDLGRDVIVKIVPPLAHAGELKEAVYRVTLPDGDPAKYFASGPTQTVRSLRPHSAEITVRSVRRGSDAIKHADDAPTDADRLPNDLIQSKDALVVDMASQAALNLKDPLPLSFALEKYVRSAITKPDYSQAFSSAAEVARTRQGDCTEHAVLLAALARARGIPARVAVGLVYAPSEQGFAYHMWTEVYVDGVWLPLDATRAQAGIPADHIKLTQTNLAGGAAITSLVPVVQLIGQLKIEVLKTTPSK